MPSHLSRVEHLGKSLTLPDAAAEKSELREWVELGLETLEPDDRAVVELRFFQKLSFDEIGERLGVQPATARQRLNRRALPKLAQAMKAFKNVGDDLSATWAG